MHTMYYFPARPLVLEDKWQRLRKIGRDTLSPEVQLKLEWIIFYHTVGCENATRSATHFGISRKTLHKWLTRFNERTLKSLEEHTRAPRHTRTWMVTRTEEDSILALRKKYLKYGKKKLKVLYQQQYGQSISTWKIERVIRKHHLYPDLTHKNPRDVHHTKPKKRIQELSDGYSGTLWHTDSIILWWYGIRRIIFTALEDKTKVGYGRVYQSNTSRKATDFLRRLVYLSNREITIIHSDNGSEFSGEFEAACTAMGIEHVYSRVRQPKDNPCLERFNWTVQNEWLALSEVGLESIDRANLDLTQWLIEYNNHRPHQALDYQTPLAYAYREKVLPMSPASTLA